MYYYIAEFKATSNGQELNIIEEMSEELYTLLNNSSSTLSHFLFSNNYYKMLKTNINELLDYVDKIERNQSNNNNILILNEKTLNINRLTINLLGIFFSYINHFEHDLKEFRGKTSTQVKKFKEITSKYFDNYFEYRFLYKLRNYSVHCSLPITTLSSSIENPVGKYYIDTKNLLENFSDWGSIVKNDLIKLDNIEIKELIQKSSVMFDSLHKELVLIDNFSIYTDIKLIEDNMPKYIKYQIILI